jgi:hypothetical protein
VLDIDDTDDAVHGQQQLALFNTHAGGYCFQPITTNMRLSEIGALEWGTAKSILW